MVADDNALLIRRVALEQPAVAVGRLADDLVNALAALPRGRIHPVVKQGVPPAGVKAGRRRVVPVILPQRVQDEQGRAFLPGVALDDCVGRLGPGAAHAGRRRGHRRRR